MTTYKGEDFALLRKFSETGNQAAFRALVERYTGMVYGVALRRTGNEQLSEEIAQNVFLSLARKAEGLSTQHSLGAWLHRATMLESLHHLRKEGNRQRHLSMIREQQDQSSGREEANWCAIRPYLDQLLNRLSSRDRDILILHYIEGLKFSEVGQRLGMSPDAAQKRSVRALGKISGYLKRYGVVASTAFLTKGLQAEMALTAPAGLAGKIGGASLATASAGTTTGTFTTILTTMTTSKLAFGATFLISALTPTVLMSLGPVREKKESRTVEQASMQSARLTTARSEDLAFDRDEFRRLLKRVTEDDFLQDERVRALKRLMMTLDLNEVKDAIAVLNEVWNSQEDLEGSLKIVLSDIARAAEGNLKYVLSDIAWAAYARWAEMEPEEAMAQAIEEKGTWGYYSVNGAWHTWAYLDWEAALAWEVEHHDPFHIRGFLDGLAERDSALALERANDLAAAFPKDGDDYLKRVLKTWGRFEPQQAIEWMDENLTEPVKRDELIGEGLEGLGEYHPEQALDQMGLIGNEARVDEVRYNIFWQWSLLQPTEAGNYFEQSGGGDSWGTSMVRAVGEALSRNQPARSLEIAKTIQGEKEKEMFYNGILSGIPESELGQVLEAANEIGIDGIRTNGRLRRALSNWAERDREAAKEWVEGLPAGPKEEWSELFFPRQRK